jgi:hypothetical protein
LPIAVNQSKEKGKKQKVGVSFKKQRKMNGVFASDVLATRSSQRS